MPTLRPHLVLLAAAALALAACGGAGETVVSPAGPGASPQALFDGPYHLAIVRGDGTGGPEEVQVAWGGAHPDGISLVPYHAALNTNGAVNPPIGTADNEYAIDPDRRFSIGAPGPGWEAVVGGISEDGSIAAATYTLPGLSPTVWVFGRAVQGYETASLSGTWQCGSFGGTPGGVATHAGWGTVTFDGAGGGISSLAVNQEGANFGPADVPVTWTVAADGSLTLGFNGGATYAGGVAADGDVVVLGGAVDPGEGPALHVLVRRGTGLTDADLEGFYFLVGLTQAVGTDVYTSFAGHALFDGAGVAQIVGTVNEEGSVSVPPLDGLFYAVAPDGALTVTTVGGDELHGGLSPGARFGVISGPVNAGSDPALFLLFR